MTHQHNRFPDDPEQHMFDEQAQRDPPHYTACPNPFLPEIVARWQQEREDIGRAVPMGDLVYLVADDELQIVRVTGISADPPLARLPPPPAALMKRGTASTGVSVTTGSRTVACPSSASPSLYSAPSPSKGRPIRCSGSSATAWSCTRRTRPRSMCC
ncbi:MAG: hypothetical protein HC876_20830 [Chloroflexaceae bacterium]|nr:hypothetical protein [bacterium]NJO07765.1 hypothetical protein [Chloroflexaceae bacterium]